jgi:hypothetical protein
MPAEKEKITHRFKHRFIVFVRDSITQWKVQRVVFSFAYSYILIGVKNIPTANQDLNTYPQFTSSWKILAIFVKTDCHDPICSIKSLLYAIAVMNIDVNV